MELPIRYPICSVGIFIFGTMVTKSENLWLQATGLIGALICGLVLAIPQIKKGKMILFVILGGSILVLAVAAFLFFKYIYVG